MSGKTMPILLRAGLLALGLLVGCGGSSSHQHDGQVPGPMGGAAGEQTTAGGATAPASGGSGTSSAFGGEPQNLGGEPEDLGGAAGAGATPVLELPPGCQPRTPVETANHCGLAVDCDTSPSVRTYCYRLDSGLWECQCANQESLFRLKNSAGLPACALAARLCSDKDLQLGEESCERENEVSSQDSCSADEACGKPIDLGAPTDAEAWLMRFGSASCSRYDPAQPFACRCLNDTSATSYGLLADSAEVACGPLVDFCASGATPTFDGKEKCTRTYSDSGSYGCNLGADCGSTMSLTDGVSLAQGTQRYATCAPRPGGGSECSCSNQDTAFLFQLSTPPNDASCEASIPNCDPHAVIKATGAPNCKRPSPDTSAGDSCQAYLACVQDATVDDRSITGEGYLNIICSRAQVGKPWLCSCASGQKTTQFELGAAGANATQACSQAPAVCLDRLGLQLGPGGDPMTPPDPVP